MRASVADKEVLAALESFAELPGWLADVVTPGRLADSLRRAVPEIASGRMQLLDADVDRVRAKEAEWRVHCHLRALAAGRLREIVLVGRVVPPGTERPCLVRSADVPFGEPGWECHLDDLGLQLAVEPADPALPALPILVDPHEAAALLQRSLHAAGHDVDVTGCEPRVVRYKPGSRCTIVYRMRYAGAPGPEHLVAKTHQGDKGLVAWEAMQALWARPVAAGDLVTLAEPLAYLPEQRVLVQGPVPEERTLKELARDAMAEGAADSLVELRENLSRTAVGLAALHGSGAHYGRRATWEEELTTMREVVARVGATVPHVVTAAEPLLQRLAALASVVGPDPAVSVHHDFRPAQVLLHRGRVGFIDFDGSCMAEPALDLGRFRAKLRDICIVVPAESGLPPTGDVLKARLRLLDDLCDDFLAVYRRHANVAPERVVLWETTDLMTGLLHAWTKVRTHRVAPRLTVLRHALVTLRFPATAQA